jgi:hypothetical protein
MDAAMFMIAVCQEFHWTYEEYMSQPRWFLDLIREKLVRDEKARELAAKQSRHGRG